MRPSLWRSVVLPLCSWTIEPPALLKTTLLPEAASCEAEISGLSISAVWNSMPSRDPLVGLEIDSLLPNIWDALAVRDAVTTASFGHG